MFVAGNPFESSLMFADKARRAYPSEHLSGTLLIGQALGLTHKY